MKPPVEEPMSRQAAPRHPLETVQGLGQLEPAAADERRRLFDVDRKIGGRAGPGLSRRGPAAQDEPGHDEGLGFFAGRASPRPTITLSNRSFIWSFRLLFGQQRFCPPL